MISVLLATYNWPQALKLCLESLGTQTDLNFEIIIVTIVHDPQALENLKEPMRCWYVKWNVLLTKNPEFYIKNFNFSTIKIINDFFHRIVILYFNGNLFVVVFFYKCPSFSILRFESSSLVFYKILLDW